MLGLGAETRIMKGYREKINIINKFLEENPQWASLTFYDLLIDRTINNEVKEAIAYCIIYSTIRKAVQASVA